MEYSEASTVAFLHASRFTSTFACEKTHYRCMWSLVFFSRSPWSWTPGIKQADYYFSCYFLHAIEASDWLSSLANSRPAQSSWCSPSLPQARLRASCSVRIPCRAARRAQPSSPCTQPWISLRSVPAPRSSCSAASNLCRSNSCDPLRRARQIESRVIDLCNSCWTFASCRFPIRHGHHISCSYPS
jgi:hypothetical protein